MSKKLKKPDRQRTTSEVRKASSSARKDLTLNDRFPNSNKDYAGGPAPRVGGKAVKSAGSGLTGASKAQVKASKKNAVKPTVSKAMKKYTRKKMK